MAPPFSLVTLIALQDEEAKHGNSLTNSGAHTFQHVNVYSATFAVQTSWSTDFSGNGKHVMYNLS